MKYAKELTQKLNTYSNHIRNKCLQYIKWKKLIKTSPSYVKLNWEKILLNDCKVTETLFNKTVKSDELLELSIINTNTFYKICKRLQKKLNISALDYMNFIIKSHKYRFTACSCMTLI